MMLIVVMFCRIWDLDREERECELVDQPVLPIVPCRSAHKLLYAIHYATLHRRQCEEESVDDWSTGSPGSKLTLFLTVCHAYPVCQKHFSRSRIDSGQVEIAVRAQGQKFNPSKLKTLTLGRPAPRAQYKRFQSTRNTAEGPTDHFGANFW